MRWHFTRHDPLFLRQVELSLSDCPLIPLHVLVCVLSCNVFSVSVSLASFMPVVALQTDP